MSRRGIILVTIAAIGGLVVLGVVMSDLIYNGDQADSQTLAVGRTVYREHCANCHGAKLEGQPDWQTPLASGRLPAPPHDASGHTWHHSDRLLFEITKHGTAAVVGHGHESDMPGFGSVLSGHEIRAVLSFIKSTWPERERRYQRAMTRRDTVERSASEKIDSNQNRSRRAE